MRDDLPAATAWFLASGRPDRLLFLGDDADGVAVEVFATKTKTDQLLVIHAMPLRPKYRLRYQEAVTWRK